MLIPVRPEPDLMPPSFAEGLDDWSRGDGTPETPTWEDAGNARVARGDPDFGACFELRMEDPVERLRYMGELPVRRGGFIEIAARLKALRGPLPAVRVAAWPGAAHGRFVPDLPVAGPLTPLPGHGAVLAVGLVIGAEALPGVGLVWDARVLYAHVGFDLVGPEGGVVRVESLQVRDVTRRFRAVDLPLPGFEAESAVAR